MGMLNRSRIPVGPQATTPNQPSQPQLSTQTPPTQPIQQNGSSSTANIGSIFQSLIPMIMGGMGNAGRSALSAVNSGGNFNPGKSAIQPQFGNNAGRMVNAAAGLGNLSRFGQPANTMPREMPKTMPTNAGLNAGQAVNTMPAFTGQTIATETSSFNPPKQPSPQPAFPNYGSLNSKEGIANAWQNATNNGQNGAQAGSALTTMLMNSMSPAERQKYLSTGQTPQPSSNPFAKRSLIA